jgi:hypothetical protein
MRKFLAWLCVAAGLLAPIPAWAITLTSIGTASSYANPPEAVLNVGAAIAIHSTIVITIYTNNSGTVSCSDTKSNAYVEIAGASKSAGGQAEVFLYVTNATALTTSDTITCTATTGDGEYLDYAASYAAGPLIVDATGAASGTSATPSITSSAPTASGELNVGFVVVPAGGATITQPGGWATPPNNNSVNAGTEYAGNLTNSGNLAQTYAPALAASASWLVGIASFSSSAPPSTGDVFPFIPTGPLP